MTCDDKDKFQECFECHKPAMFLIKVYYYDLYKHYDGEGKERLICRKCFVRRIGGIIEDSQRDNT